MKLDADKVRWHRDSRGWTLETTAEKAEVALGTVLRAEHGEDIRPSSGRRIARAFGVDVSELVPEKPGRIKEPALAGKADAPRETGRAEWDAAVRNARQLRGAGHARMEALLSSWSSGRDRQALREMGLLLDEALDARNALEENVSTRRLDRIPIPEWEEVVEADRFYLALVDMVLGTGRLSIRRERKAHEVEDAA
jgi:transcriptional regulator with XRE-family HTH domain